MVQKDLKEKGYNKEEEFFNEMNRKLIEKKRQEREKLQEEKAPSSPTSENLPKKDPVQKTGQSG